MAKQKKVYVDGVECRNLAMACRLYGFSYGSVARNLEESNTYVTTCGRTVSYKKPSPEDLKKGSRKDPETVLQGKRPPLIRNIVKN